MLMESMQSNASALRGGSAVGGTSLESVFDAARSALASLEPGPGFEGMWRQLETRRSLMECQLAIESWIDEWQSLAGRRNGPAQAPDRT